MSNRIPSEIYLQVQYTTAMITPMGSGILKPKLGVGISGGSTTHQRRLLELVTNQRNIAVLTQEKDTGTFILRHSGSHRFS